MNQLISNGKPFTPKSIVQVLRDQYAFNGDTLGMGNPRAVNQLQALHSVVILPERKEFFISTKDFQLGEFIGYDLKKTFATKKATIVDTIAASQFLNSEKYQLFKEFKKTRQAISAYLMFDTPLSLSEKDIQKFIASNSESYVTYEQLGKYFQKRNQKQKAAKYYKLALTKAVASKQIEKELQLLLKECQ